MAKMIIDDVVVAESDETILIEGNHYFPPESFKKEFFAESDTVTTCFWKGDAKYMNYVHGDKEYKDVVWAYPSPLEGGIERVGKDFSGYVAGWREARVESE